MTAFRRQGQSVGSETPPLPNGYEWKLGNSGDLELWKIDVSPNVLITSANVGEFDVNGSLRAAINTIYLEQAHSIKSAGEEIVFQNLESKVFYTPVWQFTSESGQSVGEASVLVEAESSTDYYQNGLTAAATTSVTCEDTYTTTENGTVYQFHAESAEAYVGKLSLELRNSLGDAVFRIDKDVSLSAGSSIVFDKLLYRVRVGNVRNFRIIKSNGTALQVRGGLDPLKPWTKVAYRGFTDRAVVHVDASGKIPTSQLPQIDTIERSTVANQSSRLALPVSNKFRITIQSDVQRQFYLDPNANPSVLANWIDGGSVASAVTSAFGRTGNVTAQTGDYTSEQVGAIASPPNDGARRVLIGNTPTAESIVDNLTSTSTTSPLSAAQGKVLQDTKQNNITGAASTITSSNLPSSRAVVTDSSGKIAASSSITAVELSYLDGATSNLQTQIDGKQATITGGATTITSSNLTANRVLISDASGKVAADTNIDTTELGHLNGVTSNIQAQLNAKADKAHTKFGYDLVVSSQPKAIYRDVMITGGVTGATINVNNVPWVYADIAAAERSLPYWIQQITTFFKNLENDAQFDQLIGAIPASFGIPLGSWGVPPSASTDMDNPTGSGTTYSSESFELIVGRNAAKTEVYTFGFTFALFANATYDATCLNPFRIIYQTTRGASSGFNGQTITTISSSIPRCTARSAEFTVGSYLPNAFPLMFEPVCFEIDK
ncbi:hypothetical protein O1C43_000204 [Vibrio cholerae]|nr:hypothetical protein [Vibrio cholerae]EKF9600473.1 hypothetical protein [Vibrio cholerae]